MKVLKEKKIFTGTGVIENGYVRYGERISEVGEMREFIPREDDQVIDVEGRYVIPGCPQPRGIRL